MAWSYDAVSWVVSGGRWRRWQRQALPYLRGQDVLEIGCGPGHLSEELAARGFRVVGLDRSPAMLARARRRGTVVGGDSRALPFAASSFDSILLTFPAGYVRGVAFWAEVARVLRPGGLVVILEGASSRTRLWPGLLEALTAWLSGARSRLAEGDAEVQLPVAGLEARRVTRMGPWGAVVLVLAEKLAT
ncbi:MAG TPA: class I SAM-dependent methyltransferase [Chloroflexota bacterium]|nr:class I SAM-dependent methyltransferase [Chloroflexota bacterium]